MTNSRRLSTSLNQSLKNDINFLNITMDQYNNLLKTQALASDNLMGELKEIISSTNNTHYPPYDIEKNVFETTENGMAVRSTEYILSVALAGFKKDELDVSIDKGNLIIKSVEIYSNEELYEPEEISEPKTFLVSSTKLHNGISQKKIYRTFHVGNSLELVSCKFIDGILRITFNDISNEENKRITIE